MTPELARLILAQICLHACMAGRFADRHGLKRPISYSVFAAVLGAGAAVAFPVFPVLCFAALLTGGATGAAVISLQRHVGRAAVGALELRQVFSWLSIGPAVSMLVTAVLFGVYPLMYSAIGMGLCSILLGFSLGMVQPMVMSMLHQITP